MHIRANINLSKYFLLTIATTSITLAFARNRYEVAGILIVYLATVINNLMLVEGVGELVEAAKYEKKKKNIKIVTLFILKLIILFGCIALCIQFMGKRVIIPIINYIFIIFILVFCKKPGKVQ